MVQRRTILRTEPITMVNRPLADKRPFGPFVGKSNGMSKPGYPRDTGSPNQRLISMLQDAHTSEAEAIINYVSEAYNLSGPYAVELNKRMLYAANDEFDHLHKFSVMIVRAGGAPDTSTQMMMVFDELNPTGQYLDTKQAASALEEAEQDAIDSYPEIASYAASNGFPGFEPVINEIIKDEKHHHELFKKARQEIENNPEAEVSQGSTPPNWKNQDYGNKD